jgi:hypothetical protein
MKYILLTFTLFMVACGLIDESPETLAIEANQGLECNMSPEGKWGAYSDPMFGTCGYLAPFWVFVGTEGELYVEESANCERIHTIVVDRGSNNPCQKVSMFRCLNEELNLEVSMHFFLQNRSNAHPRYEGNINLEIKTLDTEESLCSGTYEVRVLYHNEG